MLAATPPAMSVLSRSPTARGRVDCTFAAAEWNIAGSGFPADSGVTPVAVVTAATMEPLPTMSPRSMGSVVSRLDAK